MRIGNSGQALAEFIYFSVCSASIVGTAGFILKQEWDRSKCAYLVFEYTHNYLVHPDTVVAEIPFSKSSLRRSGMSDFAFHIEAHSHQIIGTGQCGNHIEKVRLPMLETATW
ncbi:MAG: hypothetical protein ABIQ95_03175 [Bdellovibrionia bacterium]